MGAPGRAPQTGRMKNIPLRAGLRPAVIAPTGLYSRPDVERLLRISREVIRTEVKAGRLRVARIGGRYVFLGKNLLAWIEACAVSSAASPSKEV